MPKLIQNLRERLLESAKSILLRQGYDRLTIRAVAGACGVAVGTVYNYFPSKEVLVASVMLEDWQTALARMREGAAKASCAVEGLHSVFQAIATFARLYAGVWSQYASRVNATELLRSRHHLIIGQLGEIIRPLLARFGCLFHPSLTGFLAETLLSASLDAESRFEELTPVLTKLLQ